MNLEGLDFPVGDNMVDPLVNIHLIGGRTMQLREVSIVELSKRLNQYGFVFLSDGEGGYATLFSHGVAAITAGSE